MSDSKKKKKKNAWRWNSWFCYFKGGWRWSILRLSGRTASVHSSPTCSPDPQVDLEEWCHRRPLGSLPAFHEGMVGIQFFSHRLNWVLTRAMSWFPVWPVPLFRTVVSGVWHPRQSIRCGTEILGSKRKLPMCLKAQPRNQHSGFCRSGGHSTHPDSRGGQRPHLLMEGVPQNAGKGPLIAATCWVPLLHHLHPCARVTDPLMTPCTPGCSIKSIPNHWSSGHGDHLSLALSLLFCLPWTKLKT